MKQLLLTAVTLAGVMFVSTTDAYAGPHPGRHKGKLKRECPAANPVARSADTAAEASNPTDTAATFSTRVRCNGMFAVNDKLAIKLDVLEDGMVAATVSGSIVRKGKRPLAFSASGKALGIYTETSFRTKINEVMVNGKPASLTVSAGSTGNELKVEVKIDPVSPTHPLGSQYKAVFVGKRS